MLIRVSTEDWEIISIDAFTKSVKMYKVTKEDLKKLSDVELKFLKDNGFVLIYNFVWTNNQIDGLKLPKQNYIMLKTSYLTIIPKKILPSSSNPFSKEWSKLEPFCSPWTLFDNINEFFPRFSQNFETIFGTDGKFNEFELKDNKYVVEIELPRFKKENIKLTINDDCLNVVAEQDNLKFYKTLYLPNDVDKNIEAKLDHGVLTISIGQLEPPKPVEIAIN